MRKEYETSRLLIKALEGEAAEQVLEFYDKNKQIFEKYEIDRVENFYTPAYQSALLQCEYNLMQKRQSARFWVFEKEAPQHIIGTFSFHNIRYSAYYDCELGYKFDQKIWGKGYAKESIAWGIQIMFEELGLHRIEALVMSQNKHSKNLLKALGFKFEGIKRQNVKLHGTWCDHEVHSLLNDYSRERNQ